MKILFVALFIFLFAKDALGRELLVERPPTYELGDRFEMEFETTIIGRVSIIASFAGECPFRGYECAHVKMGTSVVSIDSTLYFTHDWRQVGYYSKDMTNRLEVEGNMFPLYEGDVRTMTVLSSQPCKSREHWGKTCMEIDGTDVCSGYTRVKKGIQFTCNGVSGKTRTVMDHQFKFPVEFQFLE